MKEGWNVLLRYDESFAGVNIWFIYKRGEQETIVNPLDLTLTSYLPSGETPFPTIKIGRDESHQFLEGVANGLADAGFRPDELKAAIKEMEAIKFHLEDMRKLVFKLLFGKKKYYYQGMEISEGRGNK